MPSNIKLTAEDGHKLQAYVAEPETKTDMAVIILQEIFGVNSHIRSVTDDFSREGFVAIAPALFDRAEPGMELGYDPASMQRGMAIARSIGLETALKDVAAALKHACSITKYQKVGIVGYCFGGTLAWLAATRLNPSVAVSYYGGGIADHAGEQPHCPVMLHFGNQDAHIGPEKIERIRTAHPDIPIYLYDAGHGFNCDQRKDYNASSAALARERTLKFLKEHLRE